MRKFVKAHGLGNDFIILDNRFAENNALDLTPELCCLLADRKIGIGCDQIIVLDESPKADIAMQIINSDGSEVEACGNATRCVAYYEGLKQDKKAVTIATKERVLNATIIATNMVSVEMGQAKLVKQMDYSFSEHSFKNCYWVDIGNPHLICFVDDISKYDMQKFVPITEDKSSFPNRINFTLAQVIAGGQIDIKTCERGVGPTLACGTAACSTAFAYNLANQEHSKVQVNMLGGNVTINVTTNENTEHNIFMQGGCIVGNFAGYFSEIDFLEQQNG